MTMRAVLVAVALALPGSAPQDAGLVGWWKGDDAPGSAEATDSSGKGGDGAFSGGAETSAAERAPLPGANAGCLRFKGGASQVVVPSRPDLCITGDLTVALWVKLSKAPGDHCRLLGKSDGARKNYGLWLQAGPQPKLRFTQFDATGQMVLEVVSQGSLPVGSWVHAACSLSGDAATVYVGGSASGTARRAASPITSDAPLTIGYAGQFEGLEGFLDDVRLYSRALSAQEVAGLARPAGAAPQGAGDGLKAEYFAKAGGKFEGAPVLTRVDATIDFRWAGATPSPDPTVGIDNFAVRWTGWIKAPSSQTFTFHARIDDGVRLWIDDILVIEDWMAGATRERSGNAPLVAGRLHSIKMEFWENNFDATAHLFWSSPTVARQIVPTEVLYSQFPDTSLAAVPSPEDQKKVEAVVKDLYRKEYAAKSVDDRKALALELLQKGLEANDDLTTRYVMLREAKDLAAGAGDVATALRACDALAARHAVDPFPLKIAALDKGKPAASTEAALRGVAEQYLSLGEAAVAADRYDDALDCLKKVQALGKDAVLASFATTAKEREKRMSELKREYQKVAPAAATLRTKPDDPAANLALGRFLCFEKEDWARGLSHLAKGSDEALKRLAELESAGATSSDERMAMADGWFGVGEKEKAASVRQAAWSRATTWYYRGLTDASALKRLQIERRLKTIDEKAGSGGVNVLRLIDAQKDAVAGPWKWEGAMLVSPAGKFLRLQVPYELPEEYDVRVVARRIGGDYGLGLGLPVPGRHVIAYLAARMPQDASHLESVDGRYIGNGTEVKGDQFPDTAPKTVVYSVRKSSLRVTVEGKTVLSWSGDFQRLSVDPQWKVPNPRAAFLYSWDSSYGILELKIFPIGGSGKPLR